MRNVVMKIAHIKYITHGKDSRKILNRKRNTEDIKDINETCRDKQYNV